MNNDFVQIEADNLIQVTKLFMDLGGSLKDSPEIKQSLRNASNFLVRRSKESLRSVLISGSEYLVTSPTYKLKKKNSGALVGWKPLIYIAQKNSTRLSGAAWWIDRGTKERKGRGRVKATGFFQDVRDNDAPIAMDMVSDAVRMNINKILSRSI